MKMEIDLDRIRSKNQIEYGTGNTHLDLLRSIYPERTHFVFELIQNASDAEASEVEFRLFGDALHFSHNGRPFNARDVEAICRIAEGTKKDDISKVGKFGIGFKAVYNYTSRPEIYSNHFSFCIQDYVRPYETPSKEIEEGKTLFIFPFNRTDFPADRAVSEISKALTALDRRNLIFLNTIRSITWRLPNNRSGELEKAVLSTSPLLPNNSAQHSLISLSSAGRYAEEWHHFVSKIDPLDPKSARVDIAFLQDTGHNGKSDIQTVDPSMLHVCFSTHKKVPIGYLINGPFYTTPARDNLDNNNAERNQEIIKASTDLLKLALVHFRSIRLITGNSLSTLAVSTKDFPKTDIFRTIFDETKTVLLKEDLLPTLAGNYAPARSVVIPATNEIRNLFGREEIADLFQLGAGADWLAPSIADKPNLTEYLVNELGIRKITVEEVTDILHHDYLVRQPDEWLIRFYAFCQKQPPAIIKKLRGIPVVRLEDGTHVKPHASETGKLNAYFPLKGVSGLPFVRASLLKVPEARAFLQQLGITEPDDVHDTLTKIIPNLQANGNALLPDDEYAQTLRQIMCAFQQADRNQAALLESRLKPLAFLRGRHGQLKSETLLKPQNLYTPSERLVNFFRTTNDVWFPDVPPEAGALVPFLDALGLMQFPEFTRAEKHALTDQELRQIEPDDRLRGKPTDYELKGLEDFMERLKLEPHEQRFNNSKLLWKLLNDMTEVQDPPRAEVPREFRARLIIDKAKPKWLKVLQREQWLPDARFRFFVPGDLSVSELPPEFPRNKKLANLLEMKDVVLGLLAKETGIAPSILDFVRLYPEKINELMAKTDGSQTEEAPNEDNKEQSKTSPKAKSNRKVAESFFRVALPPGSRKGLHVKSFLLEQYGGKCQICLVPGFLTVTGELFFESLFIVCGKRGNEIEVAGNAISVCPSCAARLLHGKISVPDNILLLLKNIDTHGSEDFLLNILLGEERRQIAFSGAHKEEVRNFARSEVWKPAAKK